MSNDAVAEDCKNKLTKFIRHVIHSEVEPLKEEQENVKSTLKSLVSEQLNLMSIIIRHHDCIDQIHKLQTVQTSNKRRNCRVSLMASRSAESTCNNNNSKDERVSYTNMPKELMPGKYNDNENANAGRRDSFEDILLAVGDVVRECNDRLHKQNDSLMREENLPKNVPYYPPLSSMHQWATKRYVDHNPPIISSRKPRYLSIPTKVPVLYSSTSDGATLFGNSKLQTTTATLRGKGKIATVETRLVNRLHTQISARKEIKSTSPKHPQMSSKIKGSPLPQTKTNSRKNRNAKIIDKNNVSCESPTLQMSVPAFIKQLRTTNKKVKISPPRRTSPNISLSIRRVDRTGKVLKSKTQSRDITQTHTACKGQVLSKHDYKYKDHCFPSQDTLLFPRSPKPRTLLKCGPSFGIFTLPHQLDSKGSLSPGCGNVGGEGGAFLGVETFTKSNDKVVERVESDTTNPADVVTDLKSKGSLYFYPKIARVLEK